MTTPVSSCNGIIGLANMLFDWLVVGEEGRALLDSIDCSSLAGMHDRALIALMTYFFVRVGTAAGKMRVEDVSCRDGAVASVWIRRATCLRPSKDSQDGSARGR